VSKQLHRETHPIQAVKTLQDIHMFIQIDGQGRIRQVRHTGRHCLVDIDR